MIVSSSKFKPYLEYLGTIYSSKLKDYEFPLRCLEARTAPIVHEKHIGIMHGAFEDAFSTKLQVTDQIPQYISSYIAMGDRT